MGAVQQTADTGRHSSTGRKQSVNQAYNDTCVSCSHVTGSQLQRVCMLQQRINTYTLLPLQVKSENKFAFPPAELSSRWPYEHIYTPYNTQHTVYTIKCKHCYGWQQGLAHLRLAAAVQLLHWPASRLGSRSKGLHPWLLMLASTLLWACTRRGCRAANQSWWHLEQ